MTPEQATEYAKHVDQQESERDLERVVLCALLAESSPTLRKRVMRKLLKKADAFQRADMPGHEVWYPHHVQVAACAAGMLSE